MGFLSTRSGTKVHVLFVMRESYSSCIAHSHSLEFSHVNASLIFWGSSKNATVVRSTSLVAIHQSRSHSLRCLWGLSLGTSCEGSLDGLSFETTNSSSDEELGVDSLCTPSILVSFKIVSRLKVNGCSTSTSSCKTTFFSFSKWGTPPISFDCSMDTTSLLMMILLVSTHIKWYVLVPS